MKRIEKIFEAFVTKMDHLDPKTLGNKKRKPQQTTEEDLLTFHKNLATEREFNRKIATVYILCICIYFIIGLLLVIHYLNSPNAVILTFFIKLIAVTVTLRGLRKLWEAKTIIDTTFMLAQGLPPEQITTIIETMYWGTFRKQK